MSRKYKVDDPVTSADGPGALPGRPEPEEIVVDWGNYLVATPAAAPPPAASATPAPKAPELASRSARVVAVLFDTLLALLPWVLGLIWLRDSLDRPETKVYQVGAVILASLVLSAVQMTLLTLRGQTLGKLVLGVRIVDNLGTTNPGFVRVVVWRQIIPGLIACVPILGQVFVLFDLLSMFAEDRRCLHDLLADTKVVEA